MFFLKELPTRQMMEFYAGRFGDMEVEKVASALAMMRQASLLIRRLESYFSEHGFSQLRFLILIVIDREPEREWLGTGEIADRLDVSKPVLVRTIAAMQADGLITVETDGADARLRRVRLTEAGKDRLTAILPGYFRIISAFMEERSCSAGG